MKRHARLRRVLLWTAGICLTLMLLLAGAVLIWGKAFLAEEVESEGFRSMLSRTVSKALKVDGEFAPLSLEGWTAVTDSYRSTGWPGEAIGALDATKIRGTFDPDGVFQGLWRVDLITIEQGKFVLRNPNDALKRPPASPGKRPWYAGLMPQQFSCGWIDCTTADVEFPLVNVTGGLRGVHLGATMVGRDFKYYVKGGELAFPKLPTFALDAAEVYVTREMVDIGYAYFRDPTGGPERLSLSGRMGMREDKSIDASAEFNAMSLSSVMPEVLQNAVTGTASGKLVYRCDKTGQNANGQGDLTLTGATLANWGPLDELARLHHNPSLKSFVFEDARMAYRLDSNVFYVDELHLTVANKLRLAGNLQFNLNNDTGALDLTLDQMPVKTWLPEDLKSLTDAEIRGHLKWGGPVKDWTRSAASGEIDFGGATLRNPLPEITSLGKFAVKFPKSVELTRAVIAFEYGDRAFRATRIDLDSPKYFLINGTAEWDAQDHLHTDLNFEFHSLSTWLPAALSDKVTGNLSGTVKWECPKLDLRKGYGSGTLNLSGATLRDFDFERFLARFLKSESWLKIHLTQAVVEWKRDREGIEIGPINLFAKDQVGLRGRLRIAADGTLSGTLQAGATARALNWLPDATTTVFAKSADGLHWAALHLSGTVHHPKTDLTAQVTKQLERHPLAMIKLVARGLSWWLGDALGTAPDIGKEKREKKHGR